MIRPGPDESVSPPPTIIVLGANSAPTPPIVPASPRFRQVGPPWAVSSLAAVDSPKADRAVPPATLFRPGVEKGKRLPSRRNRASTSCQRPLASMMAKIPGCLHDSRVLCSHRRDRNLRAKAVALLRCPQRKGWNNSPFECALPSHQVDEPNVFSRNALAYGATAKRHRIATALGHLPRFRTTYSTHGGEKTRNYNRGLFEITHNPGNVARFPRGVYNLIHRRKTHGIALLFCAILRTTFWARSGRCSCALFESWVPRGKENHFARCR